MDNKPTSYADPLGLYSVKVLDKRLDSGKIDVLVGWVEVKGSITVDASVKHGVLKPQCPTILPARMHPVAYVEPLSDIHSRMFGAELVAGFAGEGGKRVVKIGFEVTLEGLSFRKRLASLKVEGIASGEAHMHYQKWSPSFVILWGEPFSSWWPALSNVHHCSCLGATISLELSGQMGSSAKRIAGLFGAAVGLLAAVKTDLSELEGFARQVLGGLRGAVETVEQVLQDTGPLWRD